MKASFAGQQWDRAEVARRLEHAAQLPFLARSPRTIAAGRLSRLRVAGGDGRTAGDARLGWLLGKRSARSRARIRSWSTAKSRSSPLVTLREHIAGGLAPAFDEARLHPSRARRLIRAGAYAGSLVSPRTAHEYGIESNGADEPSRCRRWSSRRRPCRAPTRCARSAPASYVGNFRYLNFSDRQRCRITGMTRFATFWVEGGEIVAPLEVMRFDDSLYRMLGAELEALTARPTGSSNSGTYGGRSVETSRVPGALLKALRLTL